MNIHLVVASALCLAVLLGLIRYGNAVRKTPASSRPKPWRIGLLLVLPILSAVLLYFCLFPPARYHSQEQLTILTANANIADAKIAGRVLALPEAARSTNAERIPDVATALRRYPGTHQIHIVGAGLSPRDQVASNNIAVKFSAAPLPEDFVELWLPENISPGTRFEIHGRFNSSDKVTIELLDPSNTVMASIMTDQQGRFRFNETARSAGVAMYQLRAKAADKRIINTIDVPLHIQAQPSLRVLSLSGGPNPELKYLRRWAMDAGIALDSQIQLGAGMQIASPATVINASTLEDIDLVILDERAWAAMSSGSKQALLNALRDGMGVLLRITGPLSSQTRNELRQLGFVVQDANIVQSVQLEKNTNDKTPLTLTRRPLRVISKDAIDLVKDDANTSLALWRGEGRGRIGLWWLSDTYRLVLNDDANRHGQLWSAATATLARPHATSAATLQTLHPRINERVIFCDIAGKAYVKAASDDSITPLLSEITPTQKTCAAYWPQNAGWHSLIQGEQRQLFYVRNTDEALGLKANAMREATQLLTSKALTRKTTQTIATPGSHWPWFFAWLFITALLWWLERSRIGIRSS